MNIEIKPDRKLFVKQIYIVLSVSLLIIISCLPFQILIPFDPAVSQAEVATILWPICGGLIFLLWIFALPLSKLWINNLTYVIEDDRIIIHKGIISKIQQNIPYRAVTDFMLHRSLYDRFLGIGSIRIQTAGQSATPTGYEANLAGLINCNELLSDLRSRIKPAAVESGTADSSAGIEVSTKDILTEILIELKKISSLLEK